jgi:hypothetical protein
VWFCLYRFFCKCKLYNTTLYMVYCIFKNAGKVIRTLSVTAIVIHKRKEIMKVNRRRLDDMSSVCGLEATNVVSMVYCIKVRECCLPVHVHFCIIIC